MPEGVKVTRFYETPLASVLCLEPVSDASPREGLCRFSLGPGFREILIDDKPRPLSTAHSRSSATGRIELPLKLSFPSHLVFVRSQPQTAAVGECLGDGRESGRYILIGSGLDRGGDYQPPHRADFPVAGEKRPIPFFFLNGGSDAEIAVDWLIRVPAKNSSLKVYLQHRQNLHGDGAIARLYVNGRLRREEDLGPRPNPNWKQGMPAAQKMTWDKDPRSWTLPLGKMAGRTVLITVASDPKQGNNADSLWWSRPKIVLDATQAEGGKTVSEGGS